MRVANRSFAPALVLLPSLGGLLSCASGDRDPGVSSLASPISGGQPDSIDSNVFVFGSHRSATEFALCSASLIAPNLLLTARHCVSSVTEQVVCGQTVASAPFAPNTFFASSTESIDDTASTFFTVSSVSVPSQSTELCGFDLALVTLATVVPANIATPLVPRIDRAVVRGESYRAVGYGQVTPVDGGSAGNRMGRSGLKVNCAPGTCGSAAAASEFFGDTGICSGDSGGPALDAAGKVVGVVSRGAAGCTRPIYGSVAAWKDWIVGVAKQAAQAGHYSPPFWVTTGLSDPPDPGSLDAGSAGDTGAGPGTAGFGTQGDKCGSPQDCTAGFGCYAPTGVATNAYCAQLCTAQTECAQGTQCQPSIGACIAPTASAPSSSSCAMAAAGPADAARPSVLLCLSALGLAGWRRRRSNFRIC